MDRQVFFLCIGIVLFSLLSALLLTFKYRYQPRNNHVKSLPTDPYQTFREDVTVHQLHKALKRMSIMILLRDIDNKKETMEGISYLNVSYRF